MPRGPVPIPFPLSSFPGLTPQESAGRLINCHAEPLGPGGPSQAAYHRSPGLTQFGNAVTANTGYRGGLIVNNLSYETWAGNASTIDAGGNVTSLGTLPGTLKVSIARNQNGAGADVVACDIGNGAFVLKTLPLANATATVTIGGSVFNSGDVVSLLFTNPAIASFPVTISHTLGAAETASTIATALTASINGNSAFSQALLTATSALGVITVTQQGAIGNGTTIIPAVSGTGNETVTLVPASGSLSGGSGTQGITFTGAPVPLSTIGAAGFPTPKSVAFQDGYFHFLAANNTLFASDINLLSFNPLTFIVLTSKADVIGQRVIAFSGLIFAFTTGHCEVFQDTAQPFPAYPYTRSVVLNWGLLQENAIAGFETGFDDLLWVAQDFGVYRLPYGNLSPTKVSPPDLDRLIEKQNTLGNILEASCYILQGKKFWVLSSPGGTWEFNLGTQQWNERTSLNLTTFQQGRWRASGGHPAFGEWLCGDTQSGTIAFFDDTVITELGAPQLRRIESSPVNSFPDRLRVARADFSYSTGAGLAARSLVMTITNAVAGTGGIIRLTVNSTILVSTNDTVLVSGVTGTTEANGTFLCTVIDATHIELQGTAFVNAYISGGTATDVTAPTNVQNPQIAVSWSDDNGVRWKNPVVRSLGLQGKSLRTRVSVKNTGYSGPQARRWRLDDTDCAAAFMSATQDDDPKEK